MKNKKAFTLIELVSVLVILAILALIVTPLVLNIIRKARIAADKRSIDAYGRSIELAIADYLLDNGTFPTSIEELTIEYSGDRVECTNKGINEDATIYLTECTVNGRAVTGYAYGRYGEVSEPEYEAYSVGDEITYNNVDYYVVNESGTSDSSVTLLKAEPLSVEEVNTYGGVGTNDNYVNKYSNFSRGTAYDVNGYGGMAYYTSETCGYNGSTYSALGCTTSYAQSEIKYVVDAWKKAQAPLASEARLITYDDLIDNLGYDPTISSAGQIQLNENVPDFAYVNNDSYWTSTPNSEWSQGVLIVRGDGWLEYSGIAQEKRVRPIIIISKAVLSN